MFWPCLRRRLRVACSWRSFDCAYVAERILVELPIRVVRRRARLRHSAASNRRCDFKLTGHAAGGECHRQQHCLGGFCAAASRSDRARQGGPSHGLHLRPRPSVLDGLHAAATRRFSAESTPFAEGLLSATFAARSVHTGERASSPSHPIGRCSEALVSGIEGQPSATRLRGQRPATYCGRRMPPAAALSRRARRGGGSI